MKIVDVLAPVIDGDDYSIYVVGCHLAAQKWRKPLSVITFLVPFLPPIDFTRSFSGTWYLVDFSDHGTLACVKGRDFIIDEMIEVPEWDPLWKDQFKKVVIGDRLFKKIVRFRL